MAVFAIADLHLSIASAEKSMDVFGNRWQNYTEKIQSNWKRLISDNDTVIIPGDISWALNLNDSLEDLKWINNLPGKKILMKGNHDFWWSTASKMSKFFEENNLYSIRMLYNDALEIEDYIIAGSRGWFVDRSMQTQKIANVDHEKIVNREIIRLRLSLEAAKKIQLETNKEIIVFLHFPPKWGDFECTEILNLLKEYDINRCYFGHIHGCYTAPSSLTWKNIKFKIISADYIDFIPQIV